MSAHEPGDLGGSGLLRGQTGDTQARRSGGQLSVEIAHLTLNQVHRGDLVRLGERQILRDGRFSHDWEAQASLGLRAGDPTVLAEYQHHGRVHGTTDAADAVQAVHAHGARERAAGRDVLMMARTRADVEALNTAARATAQACGEVHGSIVRLGERD